MDSFIIMTIEDFEATFGMSVDDVLLLDDVFMYWQGQRAYVQNVDDQCGVVQLATGQQIVAAAS